MAKRSATLIMADFMEGLNTMTDATGQLIHQQPDHGMKWLAVRDMLHLIRDSFDKRNKGMMGGQVI